MMRPEPTRPVARAVPPPAACETRRRHVPPPVAMWFTLPWALLATCVPADRARAVDTPVIATPVTATWTGVGLRRWAVSLAARLPVPIVVDRRLDPDTPVSLDCANEPLVTVVERVAGLAGGEPAVLTSSIRVVPRGMGDLVVRAEAARAARVAALPAKQRAVVGARQAWNWPAGAVPEELVTDLAAQADVSLTGSAVLPHDHLPAQSLPPLSLAERLDLLLADYDLRVDWRPGDDGRPAGRIIPLDADLPPPGATAEKRPAPVARPRTPPVDKPGTGRPAGRRDTFSLQVAAPLDQVLAAIAKRLGLSLDIDAESLRRRGVAVGEIVRATVKDASRDELLDAILRPLELEWRIEAGTLRVSAGPSEPGTGSSKR